MNEYSDRENESPIVSEAEDCIRHNQLPALLISLGAGLAVGLALRALKTPPPPKARLARLLEELEETVKSRTQPALRRAGAAAGEGAAVLQEGLRSGEAGLEKLLQDANRRLRKFFN